MPSNQKFGDDAAEYFWNLVMDGNGETVFAEIDSDEEDLENVPQADLFDIQSEDQEALPWLSIGNYYLVYETNEGFVYGQSFETREQAEEFWNTFNGA